MGCADGIPTAYRLYSIIHLPLAEQAALFASVYQWLKPDGYFLCIVGAAEWSGIDTDWIEPGSFMYWSHTYASTYQSRFVEMGFTVIDSQFVAESEEGHTLFLLTK